MVRRWFQRGMRPRMVKDQRYRSAYIFGAVCPARDTGAALVLTQVSVAATNLLLEEVASRLPPGTRAAMLIDDAGWHTANVLRVPPNITLVHLPLYSPELNAIEKVWQYLRDRYLSGRLFAGEQAIVDACCAAWNSLIAETGRIRCLTDFAWARQVNPWCAWYEGAAQGAGHGRDRPRRGQGLARRAGSDDGGAGCYQPRLDRRPLDTARAVDAGDAAGTRIPFAFDEVDAVLARPGA